MGSKKVYWSEVHKELSDTFKLPIEVIEYVRSVCLSKNFNKHMFGEFIIEKINQARRKRGEGGRKNRRSKSKTFYVNIAKLVEKIDPQEFEYIVTYKVEGLKGSVLFLGERR